MLSWIREQKTARESAALIKRINEAQLANDEILLMELLSRKKEMDETSAK